jgi:3-deoxy-7-phosphoheptulonate synthase
VVKVGRIAGQFAKPRSSDIEKQDGVELPSYRGDIINGIEFNEATRIPDPERQDHGLPAVGGDAEPAARLRPGRLCQPDNVHQWMLGFVKTARRASATASWPTASPRPWTSCAPSASRPTTTPQLRETDFYTSHEALLLGYEEALTRKDSTSGRWYATSGHMIWIGDRTRQPTMPMSSSRGIKNPIGLKCGPSLKPTTCLR